MLTRTEKSRREIERVEEEARRREAARRPEPWWERRIVLGRDAIVASRLQALAGQEAVLLLGHRADPLSPVNPGVHRVKVSLHPVNPEGSMGWVAIDKIYHGFRLSRVLGVFSLEEAREYGVLP